MYDQLNRVIIRYPFFKASVWILFIFLFSCTSSAPEEKIVGIWKADSLYSFANGFSHSESLKGLDVPNYEYKKSGLVTENKKDQSHKMKYELIGKDSLVYRDTTDKVLTGYKILELTSERMVLKKYRPPFFGDKEQKMFEIRFFTRVNPK
jgi:hypothetical protein